MATPLQDYEGTPDDFEEANIVTEEGDEVTQDDEDVSKETEDDLTDDEVALPPAARSVARAEKERLKQQAKAKKQMLEKMRMDQNNASAEGDADRARHRLQFLLKQAEIFQHFVPEESKAKEAKKAKGGRLASKKKEEEEDAELLRDEDDGFGQVHRLQAQPSIITGGTLREYQMQGLNWLIHLYDNGINGILADEMGLGKTLQTISLLAYLHEYRGITGPHMVIVPKSTLHNWCNEFRRFCPIIRVVKFIGNAEERNIAKETTVVPGRFDVVVTSYEMVIKEKNHFRKFHWRYIIIDEAHRIKNENSMLSKVVRLFRTNYRLLITGTPLQNNLHELWALLNFLLPEVFSSAEKFEEWFSLGDGGKEKEAEVVQQLHKVLRPFLLRRVKSDVERSLPPKKETILKIGMTEMQKKWYAGLLQKDIEALNGGADRAKLLNVVMQLRKCCNHPYLFQGAEPGPPYFTGEHLIDNSGKLVLLDKLLPKLKARESRVLIFSQMTRMLDILEDYCLYRGWMYCRIDGNTTGEDRENNIDEFNRDGSEKFIFLLSTRAGGLGINLATADVVILFDSDWNPQMDLQAMDRAHRIGQKKEVQVFRFCIESSIEEKVIEKAYKKLRLDALVIQQGRLTDNQATKVNKDDLLSMVRYGAEMVFNSTAENITDADVDAIIAKGEKDTKALNDKMQQFTDAASKFTLDGGLQSIYEFRDDEDEDQPSINYKQLIGANWVEPPKRERKRVLNYSEAEYYKNAMKSKADRSAGPRLPKMPQLQDFQFFNTKRLTELFEKENAFEMFKHQQKAKEESLRAQGASDDMVEAAMQPTPEDPQPLTEEELKEREELLQGGFTNWSRRDFNTFVRACEKYGRNNLAAIASEIDGKMEEDVRAYSKVFWKRIEELNDYEKIVKNIERGEQKIQRQQDIMNAIANKLERYKNPWQELKIQYGANKGKAYTEEEDRFILCTMHKLGYGAWDDLKAEIRRSWRFRFDWFFKSRTPIELARRCDTLIRLIEKENEDLQATDVTERKKAGGASAKKGAGAGAGRASGDSSGMPAPAPKKRKAPGAAAASTPGPASDSGTPPPNPPKKARGAAAKAAAA